ncbi:MAG: FprA family A-type flavoprotein [Candidatus Marinimicrobia bacterium]|nr:FprA family A-type flavoprotein [Candidatus Neomarinimicrobiota bacterium]
MNGVELRENIYWIGVNDRRTHLFENLWPLEKGISYNAYLLKDKKTALIDTVEIGHVEAYLDAIHALLGPDKPVDYLVINHMEPDHSGALKLITMKYPNITLVGNKTTFKFVKGFFGDFPHILTVEEGNTLDLGDHSLRFIMTPMLHWPETMMTLETREKILFTGDVFGSFGSLDGVLFDDEAKLDAWEPEQQRYYSNIVGKYIKQTQRALETLKDVEVNMFAPTHGLIWRKNLSHIVSLYDRWSRLEGEKGVVIAYSSMYGRTERMSDYLARELIKAGVPDVVVHDTSKTHLSYILSDIWKYQGLILGSPAYNNGLFPTVETLTTSLEHMGIKNRYLGIFGTATWSGGGVKTLSHIAETTGLTLIHPPYEAKYRPLEEDYQHCKDLAIKMAKALGVSSQTC